MTIIIKLFNKLTMILIFVAFAPVFTAKAADMPSSNQSADRGPAPVSVQHSIETADHQTYIIDSKNSQFSLSQKGMALFYGDNTSYVRLDESLAGASWRRHHPEESGSFFLGKTMFGTSEITDVPSQWADGRIILDYQFDYSDPDRTYLEVLYSTYTGGSDPRDSKSRWQAFYQMLQREFGSQNDSPADSLSPSFQNNDSNEIQIEINQRDKSRIEIGQFNFAKFTPQDIGFKPFEISLYFKGKSKDRNDKNVSKSIIQQSLNADSEKSDFIQISSLDKPLKKQDNSENISADDFMDMLKALFGLDLAALKKYIDEFQKLTDNIGHEESVNLRPFYNALWDLLMNEAGVDCPAKPPLSETVSEEEREWRRKLDRLAYALLMKEDIGVSAPDQLKIVTFRSKYQELFKKYVLPIKERYNSRVKACVSEFLEELKDMLANKTAQVIVKSGKDSTEFVIDVTPEK